MEITKKDLLKETNISYGQLYRWKREGLIPEAWFIKRSSYTGQETYFPKEKILKRISSIQELKDRYSLEELADLLSPEVSNRLFVEEDIEKFVEIDIELAASFMDAMDKDSFTFIEVLFMMALSDCSKMYTIDGHDMNEIIKGIVESLRFVESVDYVMFLLNIQGMYYTIVLSEGKKALFDKRITIEKEIHFQELSNTMKLKYKETFNFEFDDGMEEK